MRVPLSLLKKGLGGLAVCTHPCAGISGAPADVQPGKETTQTAERDP